ncbi:hypothetical protein MTR67_033864 [Solanum verrucosum]|uniref:Late blight resistance protein homolog R1A-10 n=1 Tax=Solanum verrucosum TaxID=315347 RepID=A0AAF0U7B8_SOLVR|nr:hypothetical protein MTR67_033864 [Solanum verrucosum]
MAAYAAVTSLMGTMHLLSQSSLDLHEGKKEHLESLYDKDGSLLEFLDNSDNELMTDLQKKVKDLANEVEDEIESQALLIMEKDEHIQTEANERLLKILQQAIPDIDNVKEELSKQRKNNKLQAGNGSVGGTCSPQSDVSTIDNNVVGYNIEQEVMLRQLTGDSFQMEVISIVGMGGIGKSTFAKRMFSDPSVVNFFDVREWITVSKDYSLRNMLLSLLQDATGVKEEINPQDQGNDEVEIDNAELADRLQKSFKGKRYLIVVDDIWSREAWDEIRLWFPENNNTSRILLTTRIMEVARYASYPKNPFPMRPLEPKESWDLFCQKAFGEKDCPTKFRTSGKVIVENCKGLPLILSVVAGTLSSKRTLDEWNQVAQGVSSLVNVDDYQHCSRVLALSYNYLPSHLKACFLYFGVFPKASEISVKKLIRLWIAEGLFELRGRLRELEEVADSLLHDLIDKSLVMVSKRSLDGKIKTFVPQDHRWVSVHSDRGFISPLASFPPNLKKLTLCKTFLLWEDMAIISKLPKLEVLQLKAQAFECNDCNGETVWEVTDMGFPVLKFFLLEWLDLEYWRATDDYFPCLERIIIRNCNKLKEIPQVLADSVTLQLIELRGCSSLVTFATKIQENHEDLGNNILKVDAFDTIRGKIEYFICIGSVKCVGNEDTFERVKYVCPTEEDANEEEVGDRRGSVEPPYSHMAPPLETEEEKKVAEERAATLKASGKKKESGKSLVLMDVKP